MKKIKKQNMTIGFDDYIKANRKASRELERELLGDGFKSKHKVIESKKTYSRKRQNWKYQSEIDGISNYFLYICRKDKIWQR